jgi:hypothetical protein
MQHELAKRIEQGIVVRLLWDSLRDRVIVRYRDERSGDAFVAEVPKDCALNAFEHPNAYRPAMSGAVS